MYRIAFALAAAGSVVSLAQAQVNGSIVGDGYGAAYAVQTVQTGFGDANPNNGSELNAAYARIAGGRFYLALTGNLEANFNKLEIFLQTGGGGSNVFDSSGNDNAQNMDGLTFASGFAPNYHLIARRGNGVFDLDFANLNAQSASGYFNILNSGDFGTGATGTGVNGQAIEVGYNGSNIAGVTGGSGPADQMAALAVTTGLELSIALSDLGLMGLDGEQICVMAFVNNQDHNYASNQFLPGLNAPHGNMGSDGMGNFTGAFNINLAPHQPQGYFVVPVPAPSAAAVLGFSAFVLARRRR